MPNQQEPKPQVPSDQDEHVPDAEHSSQDSRARAKKVSSNSEAIIEEINDTLAESDRARDDVLDEFDQGLISELRLVPGQTATHAAMDALAQEKVNAFVQKGGQ